MKIFDRKTGNIFPFPAKMAGFALGFGGIVYLLQNPLIGVLLLVLSVLIIFSHYGVVLNLDTLQYKEYWDLFGLKFGSWKSLPKIWRITLTNDKVVYRNQSHGTGLSTYSSNTKTALNLRINEREFIRIARGKYKDIKADALFLSDQLRLEILDATTDAKEIINPKKKLTNSARSNTHQVDNFSLTEAEKSAIKALMAGIFNSVEMSFRPL